MSGTPSIDCTCKFEPKWYGHSEDCPSWDVRRKMWVCSKHDRWVKIERAEGDTLRPCPECPSGSPAPVVLSKRPTTGLMA